MSFGSDPWLDAKLRNVPLPVGLVQRLNQISAEGADRRSPEVQPAPDTAGGVRDVQLDAALNDVTLPAGFMRRLRAIGRTPRHVFELRRPTDIRHLPRLQQLAFAASLLLAVGVGYRTLVNRGLLWNGLQSNTVAKRGAGDSSQSGNGPRLDRPDSGELTSGDWEHDQLLHNPQLADSKLIGDGNSNVDGQYESPLSTDGDLADLPPLPEGLQDFTPILPPLPKLDASKIGAESLFGSVSRSESLPVLEALTLATPRGIVPPLVSGYDVLFELKHGDHPFASPAAHADLRSVKVPLVTERGSFDLAWRSLREGRMPTPSEIRVEEFLSAIDYGFAPPPTGAAVAIRTAAGPSPLGETGLKMLQVGVQAGPLAIGTHPATNVTVAVDTSASMRRTGRLDVARRALVELSEHLRPQDRLTVVMLDSQAEIVIDHADRENITRVFSAILALPPQGGTQPHRAIESATAAARRSDDDSGNRARRLVFLTDGATDFGLGGAGQSEKLLADAASAGIKLLVVDLSRAEQTSPALSALAHIGQGELKAASSADQARFAILEAVTGQKAIVARQASLRVTFNPATVASYRLLGHEATTLTGTGAVSQVDLRADQAATAFFEVWLKSDGGDDVAVAEAEWQDAQTGQAHKVQQRISRLQFARSFAESPLSLQAAAIAAETAETLRGSYFAPGSRALARVLDLASQAPPRLGERASFRALVTLVRQAEKVRAHGAAAKPQLSQSLE